MFRIHGKYDEYTRKFSTMFTEFSITKRLVCKLSNIKTVCRRLVNVLT